MAVLREHILDGDRDDKKSFCKGGRSLMSDKIIRKRKNLEGISSLEKWNETLNLLISHESLRNFQGKGISEEALEAIILSARSTPTSSNLLAYNIVAVRDESRKERLAGFSGNQGFIKELLFFWCFMLVFTA